MRPQPRLFLPLQKSESVPGRLCVKCRRGNELKVRRTRSPTASSPLRLLCRRLSIQQKQAEAFPVSQSLFRCTLYYSASVFYSFLSAFLSAHTGGNNVCKKHKQKQKRQGKRRWDWAEVASIPGLSLLLWGERACVCLCAQGFDTAIQVLPLPWRRMPYKASGVKEH